MMLQNQNGLSSQLDNHKGNENDSSGLPMSQVFCFPLSPVHVDVFLASEPSPSPVIQRRTCRGTSIVGELISELIWLRSIESMLVVSSLTDTLHRREVVVIGGLHVLAAGVCFVLLTAALVLAQD